MRTAFISALLIAGAAFAQSPDDDLRSKIASVRYPPLAEAARVRGDVHLKVSDGAVTFLDGHPLLAPTSVEATKSFAPLLGSANIDVTYHFAFVSVSRPITVKRGDAFGRAILRLLGLKTEKVAYTCDNGVAPESSLKDSGTTVEIWVYGRDRCVETEYSTQSETARPV